MLRESNPYTAQIERLEDELEAMRQRAEAAERALGRGGDARWASSVAPLTLYETRVLRLLARADMPASAIIMALAFDYPNTSVCSLRVMLTRLRRRLPDSIAPAVARGWYAAYTIPDRAALAEFLATGVVPEMARAA